MKSKNNTIFIIIGSLVLLSLFLKVFSMFLFYQFHFTHVTNTSISIWDWIYIPFYMPYVILAIYYFCSAKISILFILSYCISLLLRIYNFVPLMSVYLLPTYDASIRINFFGKELLFLFLYVVVIITALTKFKNPVLMLIATAAIIMFDSWPDIYNQVVWLIYSYACKDPISYGNLVGAISRYVNCISLMVYSMFLLRKKEKEGTLFPKRLEYVMWDKT